MTVLIFHGLYFNPKKPPTGPGMIKLQASSSNGVHIDEIQYAGQTIMRNVWMDQDKDPKFKYCPCNRYDRQCTDSQVQDISWSIDFIEQFFVQHFRAVQFQEQTKQVTGAVCASTGPVEQPGRGNGDNVRGNGGRGNGGRGNGGNFQPNGGGFQPNGGNFNPNGGNFQPNGGGFQPNGRPRSNPNGGFGPKSFDPYNWFQWYNLQ